jgi:protein-S-isoprenylcysteine O-methyltransferase Ste14
MGHHHRSDSAGLGLDAGHRCIYRFTRNPMYLGFAGVLRAWGLHLQAWWSLPLPLLFCLYITFSQILPEEDALEPSLGRAT